MNITEYYETIRASIEKRVPGITIQKEIKTENGENRTGIRISKKDVKASPLLWLDYYYNQYKSGYTLEETIQEILCDWKDILADIPDIPENDLNEWEKAKHRIFLALVSENMQLPEDALSRKYLDMKLVIRYCVIQTDTSIQSFPVPQKLAEEFWHATGKQLFQTAWENTSKLFPPTLYDLFEFLHGFSTRDTDEPKQQKAENKLARGGKLPDSIYILTNRPGVNGATAICHRGLLNKLYHRFGNPYYVIPSSIHETLIYPESKKFCQKEQYSPENMKKTIAAINRSSLKPKERLSDSLYYYDGKELTIAGEGGKSNE